MVSRCPARRSKLSAVPRSTPMSSTAWRSSRAAIERGHRHGGLAVALVELERHERFLARIVVEPMGEDEALRRRDVAIDARDRVLASIVQPGDEAVGAADAQIDLAQHQRRGVAAVPRLEVLGLGPRIEHALARRIEHAGEDELPVGRSRQREGVAISCPCVHAFSPSLAAPADTRPGDRASLPKGGDSARASRRRPATLPARSGTGATAPRGRA